jgi:hypothetical protein
MPAAAYGVEFRVEPTFLAYKPRSAGCPAARRPGLDRARFVNLAPARCVANLARFVGPGATS